MNYLDFLTEEEYLDILDSLPKENQYLDDNDPNNLSPKWVVKHLGFISSTRFR